MKLTPPLVLGLLVLCLSQTWSSAQVQISEIMADNKNTLADEDGQFPDWIEVYNLASTNIDLKNWSLTDDPTHVARWFFPATNLTAKGLLVVFASGKNRALPGAPLHTDFSLKAGGEYLALLKPDGSIAMEFSPQFPSQFPDFSYGISQNITTNFLVSDGATVRALIPANGNLGSAWQGLGFDDSTWLSGQMAIGYETDVEGFAVYNYLASVGTCSMDAALAVIQNPAQQLAVYSENASTINYFNTGGSANYGNDRTFPGFTIGNDMENFVLEAKATITIPSAGNWTFGVNSDDGFKLSIGSFSMSYPDPRGPADTLKTFNFPAAGDYPLDLVFYECGGGSEVELYAASGSYSGWDATHFRLVGDTANGGLVVKAPVVSGGGSSTSFRSLIRTDVKTQMKDVNATAYIRIPFALTNATSLESLTLRVRYDDGFVAYLNGEEIARRNAPTALAWNSTATASRPNYAAVEFVDINISDRLPALKTGSNLLAVQALNAKVGDSDFLFQSQLVEYKTSNPTNMYFATPTPGELNGSGFVAFVADTKFSVERGFYDTPFSLSITTATEQASIIYTTDGSTPAPGNGTVYSTPLTITKTTVVRAAAFKAGFQPSNVDTESYIFVNDVIRQSPNGQAPPGWPASWGDNVVDYGMDPDVVNNALYSSEVANDLKSIPTYSVVTELDNLFDPATGIYANPGNDGILWERPASFELIYPDGTKGFHINGGLRIRGGYSRSTGNPKHGLRAFFRQEYGTAKLQYPAFAKQNGATEFDGFDLRTFQNYSWSFEGDYRFIGLRDQFSRDTQLALGQPGARGDFYHLYINGQYWGVYNTDERPEAAFGASYFGGNKEDYDVIKVDTGAGYTIFATDGTMDAWIRLWQAATNGFASNANYFKVQGLNVDGTPNPAFENLLDVDNLIDYMLVIFFTGNIDAPVSAFLGDSSPNNMYAIRNRTGLHGGFRFIAHDSEHTLLHESSLGNNDELHRDRTGPFSAGDPTQQGADGALARSNPQYFFTRLSANPEFRLRVADRIQKQFFNGGVFTTEGCRARFTTRSNEIYRAIADESARWGDSKASTPLTRNAQWATEMKRVYNDYFVQRPGIVLGQLRTKNLFPALAAPVLNQNGGNVTNGFSLTMTNTLGTIYYTLDGSDPRLLGGAVSSAAKNYVNPISLVQSTRVRARVLNGSTWSAITDVTFYIIQDFKDLLITEIMYHPPGTTNFSSDQFEFIELKNVARTNIELSGVHFTNGLSYTFPLGTIAAPGQILLLVSDPAGFTNKYPGVHFDGVFGGKLSNSGETLTLAHVTGATLFSVTYSTRPPWPVSADGGGFSLVPTNPNFNPDPTNAANWRASTSIGGSPGVDDAASGIARVIVNEALTHTDPPQVDSVELYNPNPTNVNIGYWYLTDQRTVPQKYQIPAGTVIPANGYLVLTETQWDTDPASSNSFRLNSHGEEIYLFSGDAQGNLTGYSDGFAFGAAQNGVSFGRYITSTGEAQYPAQAVNSLGSSNTGPRIGPLVFNEIQYHPAPGFDEFIELKSLTNGPLRLYDPDFPTNTWKLSGVGFQFPMGMQIPPNGLLLLVGMDPDAFRSKYSVPAEVQVFGPFSGALQDGGETLAIQSPDHPDIDTNTGDIYIPYYDVDVVRYNDKSPWPTNAAGTGPSLERINAHAYGNDPVNWRSTVGNGTPGFESGGNRKPVVNAGPDQAILSSNFPVSVTLSGSVTDDGLPDPPAILSNIWVQLSGPASVAFVNPAQPVTSVDLPSPGSYVLRLASSDGQFQVTDDVTITAQYPLIPLTLVAKGSVWKYLDNGTDQGTAWRDPAFSDATWKSGPAPLGYGDANGQFPATTNSYGSDANNKYVTTYYRLSFVAAKASSLTNLVMKVQRDDGVVVYLNGVGVFTNNMPESFDYRTLASGTVGNADETTFYPQNIDAALVREGANVLAAEVHQGGANSSDIIFDLELAGEGYPVPTNQRPQVNAGADQSVTLPDPARLRGSASDDGLPISPGKLNLVWTKVSGPGQVVFADLTNLVTSAAFSAAGTYVLRLTANDGELSASDDLTVNTSGQPQPLQLLQPQFASAGSAVLHLKFLALAGFSYSVQYRNSLTAGTWLKLSDVNATDTTQIVEVIDPGSTNIPVRYYRVVTPRQP